MISVVPTILVSTTAELEKRVAAIAPHFLKAQLDVLNNTSVTGETFADPAALAKIRGVIEFEIDLMVDTATYDLEQWNLPWVYAIIVHVESTLEVLKTVKLIQSWGKQAILAYNPETKNETIEPFIKSVDGIMAMDITPGKSGNPFRPEVLDKLKKLHAKYPKLLISVDGGVTNETLRPLLDVGATHFAVGSYLANNLVEEHLLDLLGIIEVYEARQGSK